MYYGTWSPPQAARRLWHAHVMTDELRDQDRATARVVSRSGSCNRTVKACHRSVHLRRLERREDACTYQMSSSGGGLRDPKRTQPKRSTHHVWH